MAVSILTVPLYLRVVGDERFGVLTIVWLLLGYFGVFDLGLSRATANRIAQLIDAPSSERESVFWTAFVLNVLLGMLGGLVFYLSGELLLGRYFNISPALRGEVIETLPWMAAAIPVSIVGGVFTGALEARQRFAALNSIQLFGTFLLQALPLAVAWHHGPNLDWLIPSVIISRAVSLLPLMYVAAVSLPLTGSGKPRRNLVPTLFSYGAWVTVSNFLNPLLETLDRMLIASVLSASSMTYYTVPFNLATRVKVIPSAIARTLFPRLSAQSDSDAMELSAQVVRALGAVQTPIIVFGVFAMSPFLRLWVGVEVASHAAYVGEIVLAGVWINSIAFIPYAHLQAQGRPDLVARLHLCEVLPFIGVLWFLLQWLGMTGAAVAWSLRVSVDALLLFWVSGLARPSLTAVLPGSLIVVLSVLVTIIFPWPSTIGVLLGCLLFAVSVLWSFSCEPILRVRCMEFLRAIGRALKVVEAES